MVVGSSGEIVRDELHMDSPTGWKATGAVAADVPRNLYQVPRRGGVEERREEVGW